MRQWTELIKNITIVTQFGLSFITPTLICLGLCRWITSVTGVGGWIYIPGFFFGLGGSFMVAYRLYLSVTNHHRKEEKKNKISFNRHL